MTDLGSTANLAAADKAVAAGGEKAEDKDPKKNFNYPLVRVCSKRNVRPLINSHRSA